MKNISEALRRFQKMYQDISTKEIIDMKGIRQLQIVKNYGLNLLKMYPEMTETNFKDIEERVETLVKREAYLSFKFKF